MPLNWNLTKVSAHEHLHQTPGEWAKTETLIWATMAISMSSITEDNWSEFWSRFEYVDRLVRINNTGVTYQDVMRRVGLSTNADNKTELQFIKSWGTRLLADARRDVESELKSEIQETLAQLA